MKQLQNNFTTPEQSKKLLELGVPANSADCYRTKTYEKRIRQYAPETSSDFFINHPHQIPCWSTGRLMEIYDICFPDNGVCPNTQKWLPYVPDYNLLEYAIDCIEVAVEKEYIDFSKLND